MIHLFQPTVGEAELAAVGEVFTASWLGTGERVKEFERQFAEFIGSRADQTIALTSCTEGLFQAMDALGIGPTDEVVVPSVSFVGAAHAARHTGARVVLCDVDPKTLNPTVEHVEAALTPATRAIVVLHFGGVPGDVAAIAALAQQRQIPLVEDAACGLGASTQGQPCGTLGDIGVWSFDSMKTMTTGDGGMIWFRDPDIGARIRRSVHLGGAGKGFEQRAASTRWWEIEPTGVGRRAAMNDVAAAIGLVQLARLTAFLDRRRAIAAHYADALEALPWLDITHHPGGSAASFAWLRTSTDRRDRLAQHLLSRNIYTSFRYWPLHRMRMYAAERSLPGADRAADTTLLLPLHPGLTDDDVARVVTAVRAFDA